MRSVFTDGTAAAASAPETAAGAPDPEAAGHAAEAISGGHAADVVAAAPPGPARHAVERLAGDAFVAGIDRVCLICGVVAVAAALLVFAVVGDERGQREGARPDRRPHGPCPGSPGRTRGLGCTRRLGYR